MVTTKQKKEYDAELARLTQAISDSNAARQYNGDLVAELLVHLGCIHRVPTEMARWGARF